MEKINISIPDNLSEQQELLLIGKHLSKKMLPPKNQKSIGGGYFIKQLETQITISRIAAKDPIVTRECPVCNTIFEMSLGKHLFINYGGSTRKRSYCSVECRQVVLEISGQGRASISRVGLRNIRTF